MLLLDVGVNTGLWGEIVFSDNERKENRQPNVGEISCLYVSTVHGSPLLPVDKVGITKAMAGTSL